MYAVGITRYYVDRSGLRNRATPFFVHGIKKFARYDYIAAP